MNLRGVLLAAVLIGGCGGGEKAEPKTADDEVGDEREQRGAPSVSAEIGGLNEDEVNDAFAKYRPRVHQCAEEGAKRAEFLGGKVRFFIKINLDGKVDHAHVESSTLGDRDTEKCMLTVIRSKSWPKPVGGEVGIAHVGYEFDMLNDVREPTAWSSEDAAPGLDKLGAKLGACKGSKSGFEATLYVGTDGNVLSAGVTPPDEEGEKSVDCLVDALKGASFPSPGSWPAKVTLGL